MSETLPEALYQYPASYSLRTQGVDLSEIAPSARSRSLEQLYEYTESTSVSTGVEDSFPEIAADYFCRMQTEDPDHFKLVERYESILAQRWPMAEPKLATVAIAVAAHEEVDSVIKTLDIYKKDTSVDNFEVLMFLNMPRFNAEGGLNSSDQLHISIRKFIEDNPTFPLRVFSHTYSQPQPIGSIKKLLQDVAALRSLRHGARDPILVLSDADLIDKQRGYMDVMTRPFVDQSVDTVVGDLDWDHEAFAHYPELLIATRFHQIIDEVCRNNSGFVATPGASTSVRLSSLLRLGGTRKVERGEDVFIGLDLKRLRDGSTASLVRTMGCAGIIQSSARRSVVAYNYGLAPNEKWRMGFYINNPEVRRFDLQAQGSIPSRQLNQARLEAILGRTVSVYEDNSKEAVELYRVVLELLGIKAGLAFEEDGRVRVAINSMSEAEHLVEGFIGANRFPESIRKSQL